MQTRAMLLTLVLLGCIHPARAALTWDSATTGKTLTGELIEPKTSADGPVPTVVYLKNLSITRLGQEADETILADLRKSGHLILVLDYAHHPKAVSPDLNADVLKLRENIVDAKQKTLLADRKIDVNHLFILMEGFRLKRDVEFARESGQGGRVLGMDIIYPSKPSKPVPALMEITCDNKDRMGSASLLFCHDTLLEGGEAAGFAVAMVDHPVPPPYKGIDDPMPQCIERMKAAVRTLRAQSPELQLNGKIGVMGFSRGGPMAALLAATNGSADLEGDGLHPDVSSRVQAALIHGNYYDYADLPPTDRMYPRFEKAWGKRESDPQKWAAHGATFYLTKDAPPMFLDTSDAESPEFRAGLENFAKRLDELGVEHVYQVDRDGRGHRVSTDPKTLSAIYDFFRTHLSP